MTVTREHGANRAADAESQQEHREDQREGVDRRAEMQGEQARPDHFGGQRGHARQADRDVHRHGAARRHAADRDRPPPGIQCGRRSDVGDERHHHVDRHADERRDHARRCSRSR